MATIRELTVKWGFNIDLKKLQRMNATIDKSQEKMRKVADSATQLGKNLSLKATLPIAALGGFALKAASDAEEAQTKFETVFKGIKDEANSTSAELAKSYGLSRSAATELLGNTGDLLTGFGFTQDKALDLSKGVQELAVDLASFTNFAGGAEGASEALTKALLGERESVKALGISIQEEDVKKQVALNRSKGLTFATERQAKAQATLELAIKQSGNAIGDFGRTSKGFANQSRILGQRLNDLAVTFGKILLPAATKIVGALTEIVTWFEELSPGVKNTIVVVLGLVAVLGPLLVIFGSLFNAILTIRKAMILLRVALAGANIQALLVPALIIAAFAVLFFVIEDLIAFFQGKKSVTGIMVEKFQEFFSFVNAGFNSLPGWIRGPIAGIITLLTAPFRAAKAIFDTILDVIGLITGEKSFGDVVKNAGKRIVDQFVDPFKNAFKAATGEFNLAETFGFGKDTDTSGDTFVQQRAKNQAKFARVDAANAAIAKGPGATGVPGAPGPGQGAGSVTQNVQAPINVNIGNNLSPEAAAAATQAGVRDAQNEQYRIAARATKPAGPY